MGLLASLALPANTVTEVYTCLEGFEVSFNVNLCNRGAADSTVRLAIVTGGVPTDASWIEYDYMLPRSGVLERTSIVLTAGQAVYAWASTSTVSVNLMGVRAAV